MPPRERKPSITTWTRLEPQARSEIDDRHLQARVHDPAWQLAIQWRLGEFAATDGGTPIVTTVVGESSPLQLSAPGVLAEIAVEQEVDTGHSLWVWMELRRRLLDKGEHAAAATLERLYTPVNSVLLAEDLFRYRGTPSLPIPQLQPSRQDVFDAVVDGFLDWYQARAFRANRAVELGQALELRLGLGAADRKLLRSAHPIRPPRSGVRTEPGNPSVPVEALDAQSQRYLGFMSGRCCDGDLIQARMALTPTGQRRSVLPPPLQNNAALEPMLEAWLSEDVSAVPPGGVPRDWIAERLEYQFTASAGAQRFIATEYDGAGIDWYSFDAASRGAPQPDVPTEQRSTVIPTPVTFRGMPASRFWELEDARVALGAVAFAPGDIGRAALVEYGLIYSDDWFVVPHVVPVGAVHRVITLEVVDTLGATTKVRPFKSPGFSLFTVSSGESVQEGLLLASGAVGTLTGPAVEDVRFFKDEMANMAFALEVCVTGPNGLAVDRLAQPRPASDHSPASGRRYLLRTQLPPPWIPFVPTRVDGRIRLQRQVVEDSRTKELQSPCGLLLQPWKPLALFEEEVPRTGVKVVRNYRYARGAMGEQLLWLGRTTSSGKGEGASGLSYDVLAAEVKGTSS